MKTTLEKEVKAAISAKRKLQQHITKFQQFREHLPTLQKEAEEAKATANLEDDESIKALQIARTKLEIQENLIKKEPDYLEAVLQEVHEVRDSLRTALLTASSAERSVLIDRIKVAIAPFCGDAVEILVGDSFRVDQQLAEKMPVLDTLPNSNSAFSPLYPINFCTDPKEALRKLDELIDMSEKRLKEGSFSGMVKL